MSLIWKCRRQDLSHPSFFEAEADRLAHRHRACTTWDTPGFPLDQLQLVKLMRGWSWREGGNSPPELALFLPFSESVFFFFFSFTRALSLFSLERKPSLEKRNTLFRVQQTLLVEASSWVSLTPCKGLLSRPCVSLDRETHSQPFFKKLF